MKNADYWRGRFSILEDAAHNDSVQYIQTLEQQFKIASNSIQGDIEKWYARFAKNNNITLLEAKKWLNADQLKEFRWTVEEYIKAGESLNPKWMRQLENASARVHISRLEALRLQAQQQIELLYGNHTDDLDKFLGKIYSNGYYHTAFEIQKGLNIGWDLQSLNPKQLQTVLSRPWTTDNRTFRDRCWLDKTQLVHTVQTQLTQGIIRGDSPDKATKAIAEQFRVSKNKAGRLVMTESAYFSAQSQKDCFNELDVERYEILATLDSHTSEICREMDGHVFDMKDYESGVTAPPFHPWCRTTTIPYFEDNPGERAARNADGEVYYVPANLKYEDWQKGFVYKSSNAYKKNGKVDYSSIKTIPNKVFKEVSAAVNEFENDFPEVLKTVDSISFGEADGALGINRFSVSSNRTILHRIDLNSEAFANPKLLLKRLKVDFASEISYDTNSIKSLVAHELGHAAHNALSLKRVGYDGIALTPDQIIDLHGQRMQIVEDVYLAVFESETFEEIQAAVAKSLGKAALNPNELIAQSFGNYYFGLEKSPIAEKIVNYFKKEFEG